MTTQPPTSLDHDESKTTLQMWAIIELFGHARIAGRLTEQVIAGQGFIRVDVPIVPEDKFHQAQDGFSRLFGPGAIYSITPVSQETACAAAKGMRVEPVNVYLALPLRASEDDIEHGAVQARNMGGRGQSHWSLWFVKKSEASRPGLVFVRQHKIK